MSDSFQGPGWWRASDGRWYPPHLQPDWGARAPAPVLPVAPPVPVAGRAQEALAAWAPSLAAPMDTPLPPLAVPAFAGHHTHDAVGGDQEWTHGPPRSPIGGTSPGQAVVAASSGGRLSRGLRLVGVGFAIVRDEPGLMMVPVVAFVAQMAVLGVAALAVYPMVHAGAAGNGGSDTAHLPVSQWAVVTAAGVATMFVSVVSHATIIARVMARFHGQEVTNVEAARAALSKSPQLLAWSFINYVVLSILRTIGNRGILGAVVGALLRAGWMLASFFVVPVILFEDKGAVSAIKRSVELCRSRWGENIVGNGALGLIGVAAVLVDVGVAAALGAVFVPLGLAAGVIGLIALLLVMTVASASFNAALYWFAVTGQAPGQYSPGDLASAYRRKARRTGIYGY